MRLTWPLLLAAAALVPTAAGAAPIGSITKDKEKIVLTTSCAFVPRYDTQGWGKPEVTVLMSDKAIDCAAIAGWVDPESAAFEQGVRKYRGALLSVSYQPGLKLGKVSVMGVGYTLGNDSCEGCATTAAYAGAGLKGSLKTAAPLMLNETPIALDVRFDLPKPAPPAAGQKLVGGGDPGKAYLAYVKAHKDGDYAALVKLMPEGKAEDEWGWRDEADRKSAIMGDTMTPKTATILEGYQLGDSALLIAEVPHPWGGGKKAKAVVGLGLVNGTWRVREVNVDVAGNMLKP